MRALFKKETLQDPEKEGRTYTNYSLLNPTEFCCKKFKEHCKKFTAWDYENGKFSIVNQITYEKHSVSTIDFCPFCGKNIEYEEKDSTKNTKNGKLK